ncbi:MAG: NADH-quinone oxidoreductase subunit M [Calditrichales bacterium]|nr:MAG: NADH-quinone oxidoreductase subunit M [Calditrichales bacterium]
MGLLSLVIFIPIIGAMIILFLPKKNLSMIKWVSAVITFIPLVLTTYMWMQYNYSMTGINNEAQFQFVEHTSWISAFNIEYFIGVDGLSFPMVWLTTLLSFLCIFASWNIDKAQKGYFSLFLLLETGMIGVFASLDLFLFYIFWELMLLPMYFLIGIWGGPRREYAAIKFFLYTLLGSVLILLAMLALYFNVSNPETGGHTFNMLHMMDQTLHSDWLRIFDIRLWLYIFLFIGFAIKVPIFPFHTWLPDAHVEAPTAISVILAGILLKMGTYGLIRISYPIFPDIAHYTAYVLAILGIINILYGAFVAMAQKDLKKLVAYSSISHMGFVLLGMAVFTDAGMFGAVFQMFSHGIITAMLFLLVGVIYDRAHHREIEGFGGLGVKMPIYTGVASLAFFAAMGLPGMSGFIAEAMVFMGAFTVYRTLTIIAALGIVITAAYVLWTVQRVFLGKLNPKYEDILEINGRELFTLVPLGILTIGLGIYPMPVLDLMRTSLNYLITLMH